MKALCISQCKNGNTIFYVGKEYDVSEDIAKSEFFKVVETEKKEEKKEVKKASK